MNHLKILFCFITLYSGYGVSATIQDTARIHKKVKVIMPCTLADNRMFIDIALSCNKNGVYYEVSEHNYKDTITGRSEGNYKAIAEDIGELVEDYNVIFQKTMEGFGRNCYYSEISINNPQALYKYITIMSVPVDTYIITFYTMSNEKKSVEVKKFFDSIQIVK